VILLSLFACIHVHQATDTFAPEGDLSALAVDLQSADVAVRAGDTLELTRTVEWTGPGPIPFSETPVVTDGALSLTEDCPVDALWCGLSWELTVPAGVTADISLGSGDATLADLTGDATVETGSGDIATTGLSGTLTLTTGSGDITVSAAEGPAFTLKTGSGDVALEAGADATDVVISTGSGDIGADVCGGAWALDTSTGSGDVSIADVHDDPQASRRIVAHTGSGDIAIAGR
jgi:hypothetical protein